MPAVIPSQAPQPSLSAQAPSVEVLAGVGVHGGRPCRLELRRLEAASGPRFAFPGLPRPFPADALSGLSRSARRATLLSLPGSAGEAAIAVPEHLLAALLFFHDAPLEVRADAAELPGLDGSALPFRDALARLFPERAARPEWREYPCDLRWEHTWEGGYIRIRPAERFRARYALDAKGLRQECLLEEARDAWDAILPARTFAFHQDWRAAVEAGLMAGAGRDSGLLLAASPEEFRAVLDRHPEWGGGPYPLLNQADWRVPEEPARHKLLDLLGDLALLGLGLPRAEIEVRNGGHAAHHRLLDRLSGLN